MPDITLEHIRDLIKAARDESRAYDEGIRTEIRGVNHRLDKVNHRLDKHDDRITSLERPHAKPSDDDKPFLTRREWKIIAGAAGGMLAYLQLLWPAIKATIKAVLS